MMARSRWLSPMASPGTDANDEYLHYEVHPRAWGVRVLPPRAAGCVRNTAWQSTWGLMEEARRRRAWWQTSTRCWARPPRAEATSPGWVRRGCVTHSTRRCARRALRLSL